MKTKLLFSTLAFGLALSTLSQSTIELTFTAENNGQYVQLDSLLIENLTWGGDTTLYAPDTILALDYLTNIRDYSAREEGTFSVSQNYPNPFIEKTTVDLYLHEREDIRITLRDVLGKVLANSNKTLTRGTHSFVIYPGKEQYCFLTVAGKKHSQTIKMLGANNTTTNGGECKIIYKGYADEKVNTKSNQDLSDFGFSPGDDLQMTGYALTALGNLGSAVITDAPESNFTYEFNILNGLRCPGITTISDVEGNTYHTVQLGDQCWMQENLKTTTYSNGTPIANITDPDVWFTFLSGAYAWNDNDISWKEPYGAFYNWHATINTNELCPTGWHVPTNEEWNDLIEYIGGTNAPQGNKMKSCRQVDSPLGGDCNTNEHPRWASNNGHWGTDEFGFSGEAGGYRFYNGAFNPVGFNGYWWSSEDTLGSNAWYVVLNYTLGYVYKGIASQQMGCSVRCLKD